MSWTHKYSQNSGSRSAIWQLIKGFCPLVPILSVKENTSPTAAVVDKIHVTISPGDERKIFQAIAVFEKNVGIKQLSEKITKARPTIVTPKMFEYELLQKARREKRHIVLPEGEEERIFRAAEALLRQEVVDITLLGNREAIASRISELRLHFEAASIIDSNNHPRVAFVK